LNRNVALTDEDGYLIEGLPAEARARLQSADMDRPALSLDLPALLHIIFHWRWLILGATALGLLAAIVATMLTTPIYRSWVTLEVNPPTVEIMDEQSRERASSPSAWDIVATQVGLLSSRSIAERAAQDLNLANNEQFVGTEGDVGTRLKVATEKITGGLKVEAPEEGQLIRFSFDSESPQLSAAIANQVAESFINSNLQRRYDASAYARSFLEKQIAKTRVALEQSERQLVSYAQAQGIINTADNNPGGRPGGDTNSLQGESLVALNRALADAVARRVAAEGAYHAGAGVGATAEVNASTLALRQTRATLEADYQDKRTMMKPDHPDMLALKSRIDELDRQISRETAQASSGRSNTLLADYRSALAAEGALRSRVAGLKGDVLNLRGRSIQYNILQREVDTNRSLYDALLQRYKEVGVAGGIGTAPVSIVDRAEVPSEPYKPDLLLNILVGLGAGLLIGMVIAVALEYLYDTIKTREDVRNKLGLACLGAVPKTAAKDNFVEELKDPRSIVSEAYGSVVASLRFSTDEGLPKTLLVTSTRSGEGKSSSSLALAQNFARRGASVLLVDCDLRKPAFKASSEKVGLTRILTSEEEDVRKHVLPTQFEDLWLLPSGPIPPNPADLLSSGRFQEIFQQLAQLFDIVICDAPPVLGLADSPLLASVVGNVMFVVESGKTRTKAALESIRLLRASGVQIVGATLTKSGEDLGGYGYKAYGYGALDRKRTEILMIPHEADSDASPVA
jgi:polysaccharide biosynthesis transport protein